VIRLQVAKDSGHIVRFSVDGHAGYGTYGHDIVCAAVSALVISSINGLALHAGIEPKCNQKEGHIDCHVNSNESWDNLKWAVVDGILKTMVSGLESIKDQYPGSISITVENV